MGLLDFAYYFSMASEVKAIVRLHSKEPCCGSKVCHGGPPNYHICYWWQQATSMYIDRGPTLSRSALI